MRKQIEEETGVRLKISNRDEYYPATRCRVLVIAGAETGQILSVLERIVSETVEVAAREVEKGYGKGREESEILTGKEHGEYVLRAGLPHACTGAIIGPRGARIKELRQTTGAKVFVENETYDGHQMVRVIGQPQAINAAMPQILQIVEDEMTEDQIRDWASKIAFDPRAGPDAVKGAVRKGGGKGKGKEDHRGGPPRGARSRSRSRGGKGKAGLRPKVRRGGEPVDEGEDPNAMQDDFSPDPDGYYQDAPAPDGADGADGGAFPPQDGAAAGGYEQPLEACSHAQQLAEEFPPGRLELAHAINCDLPKKRVDQILGRGNEFQNELLQVTGCNVFVDEDQKPQDEMLRVSVQGPLLAAYTAHLMIMKRYHEADVAEQEEERRKEEEDRARKAKAQGGGGGDASDPTHIAALQQQIAALQGQLQDAKTTGPPPRKGGKGKGGKGGGKR